MGLPWALVIALCLWAGQVGHPQVEDCAKSCDGAKIKMICVPGAKADCCAAVLRASPQVCCLVKDGQACRAVLGAGPDTTLAARAFVLARPGDEDIEEDVVKRRPGPSHWLGLLMTPVPAALAAHIGADGMMVVNVVKDSPADETGLQRYDVLVGFAGQEVDDMEDLLGAISDVKPGTEARIVIIRGGEKQKLTITPAKRPEPGDWEYRYDEPEADIIDRSLKLRGHRLRLSPEGNWLLEELGVLRGIPDVLKELKELGFKGFPKGFDCDVDIKILDKLPGDLGFGWSDDREVRVELRIEVDEDGNVTTIHRDADGKIHVERADPDDDTSAKTYDSPEEFEEDDPEGYELYERHSGHRRSDYWRVRPPAERLQKLRKRFQIDVKKKLQDALDCYKEAREETERATKDVRQRVETIVKRRAGGKPGAAAAILSVQIDDGKITVETGRGERRTIYEFDSKEEFEQTEPELYERVKSILD